jgi:protein-tyrosine phosphatase
MIDTESGLLLLREFDKIGENLYQGAHPNEKLDSRFDFAVNLANRKFQYTHKEFGAGKQWVVRCPFEDEDHLPPINMLYALADTVNQLRKAGNVLVHCEAGLNRSGMICALALMRGNEKMTARQAIDHLRKTRDFSVLCNFTFEKFLLSHDENSKAKDTC